jgi:hypothetical protein
MYFPINRRVCRYLNRILSKGRIDLEGCNCSLFQVLSRHFPRKTEENHGEPQDNRCPGQDSNRAPPG